MLLSLFRLTMIVSLLISAVCIEANANKLSHEPCDKSKAVAKVRRDDLFANENGGSIARKRQATRNSRMSNEHSSRLHGVHTMDGRVSRAGNENLARKMAKDALKSPKMQETMKKLSRGGDPKKKKLYVSVKVPTSPRGSSRLKGDDKQSSHQTDSKGRKKKKRKRHHRRHRKERAGWPRRGSAKRTLSNGGKVNAKRLSGNENSNSKHNQATVNKSRAKSEHSGARSTNKITAVKTDDTDYVDFSTSLNDRSTVSLVKNEDEGSAKLRETENMIQRLMKTTTGNPSKETTGDQGAEYSDYYSEDDVLQDIEANKIPVRVAETTNPNDRFIRQILNTTSYRSGNRIDNAIRPYYRATLNKDFRNVDYPMNSFNGFQQYPAIERRATLNRNNRLLGADDSLLYYEPSRIPHDGQNENLAYAFSTEEAPRVVENFNVLEPRNTFDVPDATLINEENQRAVIVPLNNEQFDFLGPSDKPLDVANPRTDFHSADAVPEVPQMSRKLPALDLQNLNNCQQYGMSLQHLNNIDQNVYSQSQLGTIPNVNGNIGHSQMNSNDYNVQSLPVQDNNNNNNLPSVNMPIAMDQPLGKVLESLGINVHVDSSNSNVENSVNPTYQNNVPDNMNVTPSSHFEPHDQSVDHAFTNPNCDKESPLDDTRQASNGKDGNIKIRGNQRRRQLSKNESQSSNLFSLLEGERNTNISSTVHDTKEIASQLLGTIMEELEELKLNGSKNNKNEGSWSTAQAGVKLDMKVVNRSIIVTLSNIGSPRFHESLRNGTWNVSGYAPFKSGLPFTLTATDNTTNSIAVFVGACRVCQGVETIAGVWSVARSPKDCGEFQVATSVFNDIFRKSKLSDLKRTHNATVSKNATAEHKKKRS
ncbi:uncharacterized protein LOC143362842 isoform X2 [Halictus rubicundus]|uniref:uncharacterized protein LOC143362842 isoform X2 n=1 Tax=Halictus rubicundus TaxID=77578 RepID=UPI004036A77C